MLNNNYLKQIAALISIFLLFVVIDKDSNKNSFMLIKYTLIVYLFYLLLTKNKWYFIVPVILFMVIYQFLKVEINFLTNKHKKSHEKDKSISEKIHNYTKYLNNIEWIIVILIVLGFIHYLIRQKLEFKKRFNFVKLLLTNTCK
jgi:Ca2+/Na+ antiporter